MDHGLRADGTGLDPASRFGPADVWVMDVALGSDLGQDNAAVEPDTPLAADGEEAPADALPLDVTDGQDSGQEDTADGAGALCGNGACGAGENCLSCPTDCGQCPVFCGNQVCDSTETCLSCPADCGKCPPPACSVMTSGGCEQGLQCYPDGKANLCFKAGKLLPGDACKYFNDCQLGSLCVAGLCRSLCDWSGKDAAALCKTGVPCEKLVFDTAGEVGNNLGACKPSDKCDPLANTGCPNGQSCVPYGWLKTCAKAGSGPVGSPCAGADSCLPSLLCVTASGQSVCRARCSTVDAAPTCQTGTCQTLLGPDGKATPEFVGWCLP